MLVRDSNPLASSKQSKVKDHEVANFVNELTAISKEYQGAQQLRNCLRKSVLAFIEAHCPSGTSGSNYLLNGE